VKRNPERWLLIALALFILGSRVQTAVHRRLLYFDEAYYCLEARGLRHAILAMPAWLHGRLPVSELKREMREEGDLFPPNTAKPTFSALLTAGSFLPVRLDLVGNFISLLTASLSVLLLIAIARRLGAGPGASLSAGLLFFLSPLLGFYAVSSLSQCAAMFFFLWAILEYVKDRPENAALALGLTLTSHYGMIINCLMLMSWFGWELLRTPISWPQRLWRVVRLSFYFALPAIAYQMVYWLVRWRMQPYFTDMHYMTYWEQLTRQLRVNAAAIDWPTLFHRNRIFFGAMMRSQGWILSFLLLFSFLSALIDWKKSDRRIRGILAVELGLLIFWCSNRGALVSRAMIFFLPLFFLNLAWTLESWNTDHRTRQLAASLIISLLAIGSTLDSFAQRKFLQTPYPEALHVLREMPYRGPIIDPEWNLLWQYYDGRQINFHPERIERFADFKSQLLPLFEQSQDPDRLPIFFRNQMHPTAKGPEMERFYQKIFSQPPVQSWPIPFADYPIAHFDEVYPVYEPHWPPERLNFYWLYRRDLAQVNAS
jgi:hypothetical protein